MWKTKIRSDGSPGNELTKGGRSPHPRRLSEGRIHRDDVFSTYENVAADHQKGLNGEKSPLGSDF